MIKTCIVKDRQEMILNYCEKFNMESMEKITGDWRYVVNKNFKDYFTHMTRSEAIKHFKNTRIMLGKNIKQVSNPVNIGLKENQRDHEIYFKTKDKKLYFYASTPYTMDFEGVYILFNPIFLNYSNMIHWITSFGTIGLVYGKLEDLIDLKTELTKKLNFMPFWIIDAQGILGRFD